VAGEPKCLMNIRRAGHSEWLLAETLSKVSYRPNRIVEILVIYSDTYSGYLLINLKQQPRFMPPPERLKKQ